MADGGSYRVDATLHDDGRLLVALVWLNGNVPCRLVVDTTADRTILLRSILVQAGLRPFLVSIDASADPHYRPEGVLDMDWLTPHVARVCFDFVAPALVLWPLSGESSAG